MAVAVGALALSAAVWGLLFAGCWCWYQLAPTEPPATPAREFGWLHATERARRLTPKIGGGQGEPATREAAEAGSACCPSPAPTVQAAVGTPCGWLPAGLQAVSAADEFGDFIDPPLPYDLFVPLGPDPEAVSA